MKPNQSLLPAISICLSSFFCYNCLVKFRYTIVAAIFAAMLSLANASAEPLLQRTLTPTSSPTRPLAPASLGAPSLQATSTIAFIIGSQSNGPSTPVAIPVTATPNDATPTSAPDQPLPSPRAIAALQPKYPLSLDPKILSIDSLRARAYVGGQIKITRLVSNEDSFTRALFEYPSDGLRITGSMNIPRGLGPFPVVILDHGYFPVSQYKSGDGTNRAADAFARRGYLTLASDYRCYGGSQCASNPLDVGMAIDVLNLIASLPTLASADTSRVGIWGHSMGGAITIRVLTLNDSIKVAALYAAVTGDDEVHYCWLTACRAPLAPTKEPRLSAPRLSEVDPDFGIDVSTPIASAASKNPMHDIFLKSSPTRYLEYWKAPVIINHGEKDDLVPVQWSVDLADALQKQGKKATFYSYSNEGHVFTTGWQLFMARTTAFFDQYLNPYPTPITATMRALRHASTVEDAY